MGLSPDMVVGALAEGIATVRSRVCRFGILFSMDTLFNDYWILGGSWELGL